MNLKASKKYSVEFQNKKFIDFQSRKEMIIRKLDELERRQSELLKSLPSIDHSKLENVIHDFEEQANKTNNELQETLQEIYRNRKNSNISVDNFTDYFNKINQKEKDIESMSKNLGAYRVEYEINKRFDHVYNIIENTIDNLNMDLNDVNTNEIHLINSDVLRELKEDIIKPKKINLKEK
jgi:hypothetical protein